MPEEAADQQETPGWSGEEKAKALLEAANSASERVAGLHLAFMAVCAYVLAIVFSTTDFDMLLGKGVKLPVVDVEVNLVGFYACAPFLVVLVHFNLLLQLQLLSRKLFAFDAAAPPEEGLGGLRDRLHIFPYTYYLVGRPGPLVQPLVGLMVSITLVVLPLLTLLILQLWFLAYQNQAVTWWQRVGTWLDTAMIAILWPIILHPRDDWGGYWRELLAAQVPRGRAWLPLALLFVGFMLLLFSVWPPIPVLGLFLLLVAALAVMPLRGWQANPRSLKVSVPGLVTAAMLAVAAGILLKSQVLLLGSLLLLPLAVLWQPQAPRGSLALLLTLLLGLLLPLALLVDGEGLEGLVVRLQPKPAPLPAATRFSKEFRNQLERLKELVVSLQPGPPPFRFHTSSTLLSWFLQDYRRLDLNEQVLLAKPAQPETLALIRSGEWQEGLKRIEPLNLKERHLRQAQMRKVILLGVDMREAWLHGADLREAQLQGATLVSAKFQGANLEKAELQDADLEKAQLQDADLEGAQLQGANLSGAQLQGADLSGAQLKGAKLSGAKLQGANLKRAELQGADMKRAELQGANLEVAMLQGADLRFASLQGAYLRVAGLQGADLEKAGLQGADLKVAQLQGANLSGAQLQGADLRQASLYAAYIIYGTNTELIDARGIVWVPLRDDKFRDLSKDLPRWIKDPLERQKVLARLVAASRRGASKPRLRSGLAESKNKLKWENRPYNPENPEEMEDFLKQLHAYLERLACESPWIAQGIVKQIFMGVKVDKDSSREGLEEILKKRLDDKKCPGLQGLSPEWKDELTESNKENPVAAGLAEMVKR